MTRAGWVLLAVVCALPACPAAPAHADSAEGSSASDTTSAASATPDSAATASRKMVSESGAVSVFEELQPGEGIDGFWWEFDTEAELARLLNDELKDERPDPLVDAFGFELTIPDTIRALRDSVTAVADSILAERIQLETRFIPKYSSRYRERKDDFTLEHEFDVNYPLSDHATVSTRLKSQNSFNESTGKLRDDRSISSTFSFVFSDDLTSSLSVQRSDNRQERNAELESEGSNTSVNGRGRLSREVPVLGSVETSAGLSASVRDYVSRGTSGSNSGVSPSWGAKVTRTFEGGQLAANYTGDIERARSEQTRIGETEPETTDDANSGHTMNLALNYTLRPGWALRIISDNSTRELQYLSAVDSLAGLQETRRQNRSAVRGGLDAEVFEGLTVKSKVEMTRNEQTYSLQTGRYSDIGRRSANVDMDYAGWEGGRLRFGLDRSREDRDYNNTQAGSIDRQQASVDYNQAITANVDFVGVFFMTLDRYAYDDFDGNRGDRDLKTTRGTFTVRYRPFSSLNTDLRIEVRQAESINIHPSKSPDNKTDHVYRITPSYTWKLGGTTIRGEFTADARYAVYGFREEDNFLNRTFSTRQKVQHSFTPRVSSEFTVTADFQDEGSYSRTGLDNRRLFSRSREIHRFRTLTQVRYTPVKGVRLNFRYARDGDDRYSLGPGKRTLSTRRRTQELSLGLDMRKKITKHVSLDLKATRTHKSGLTISNVERDFFNITASVDYKPGE
ncbi:MAG: hypothetical protein QGI43_08600 [Gemmatimonadota bacterium]|nr:hypothetical protein [Gemmatimonadota bacterium]